MKITYIYRQGTKKKLLFFPGESHTKTEPIANFCINYFTYGKVLREYRSTPEKYLFTGKERDIETGLDYHGARYRDSDVLPFTTIDPLTAEFPAWSPYRYGFCNPVSFTDPTGRSETNYEDERGNLIAKTDDGSDDVVTITDDKLEGFNASLKGTSEQARNSAEMNAAWKEYSGYNIKSDKLDPSTLGRNFMGTNYIGPYNPQTYPDAKGNRKWDYSAAPKNLADYGAFAHDKSYDKLGIAGSSGLFTDTRAIGADWRFVSDELQVAKLYMIMGDSKTAFSAFGAGTGLGLLATPKTAFQLSKPFGMMEIKIWDKISQPTK